MLLKEYEIAEGVFGKLRGLMFRKSFEKPLVFKLKKKTRLGTSIHSFFVFFPFDIVWLDDGKVIDLYENVKPFTFNITPKKPADCFIEFPAGFIRKHGIKEGSIIKLG